MSGRNRRIWRAVNLARKLKSECDQILDQYFKKVDLSTAYGNNSVNVIKIEELVLGGKDDNGLREEYLRFLHLYDYASANSAPAGYEVTGYEEIVFEGVRMTVPIVSNRQ